MNILSHRTAVVAREVRPPPIGLGATERTVPLRIAVVNNMSDAALRTTERQICALLQSASAGMLVDLRFYTLPGAIRGDAARVHIDAFYDSLESLEQTAPDGLIVTGAEPKKHRFEDEWFWPAMAHLIDWVDEYRIPAIWSCLAAHAAVYHRDGIKRIPLDAKLSGIFECSIDTVRHQLLHRLPRKWRVPHSRRNGLSRKQLERCGYNILSWSREVSVDMFVKHDRGLQLYLQGHPEYNAETLISEYRRDILRQYKTGMPVTIPPPVGIWSKSFRLGLRGLFRSPNSDCPADNVAMQLDAERVGLHAENCWSLTAQLLCSNWLAYLDATRHVISERPSCIAHVRNV